VMRRKPEYETPEGAFCVECGFPCTVVPLLNEFDYAGTHCTYGAAGTHYPSNWGAPVSNCCEGEVTVLPC